MFLAQSRFLNEKLDEAFLKKKFKGSVTGQTVATFKNKIGIMFELNI